MTERISRPQVPGPTFALALGLVAFIAPLAVHLFFPVIPAVKVALGLSDVAAQFNFSIALFAMALATLAYGSLSDRYGRRPLLLSGLLLFLLGSAISAVAPGASALALGRIVQAVGAGCSMTLVRTIARDAYRAEYLVRAIAYLTMFYTLGPHDRSAFWRRAHRHAGLAQRLRLRADRRCVHRHCRLRLDLRNPSADFGGAERDRDCAGLCRVVAQAPVRRI